jgi:hypothetical protein
VDPRELDKRREAAQRDAAGVKPAAPRIRLLNTPPHRNLDGERGGELGEDASPAWSRVPIQPPNAER